VINAVVFDMDGVLCRYRIERRLALLASWSGQGPDVIHAAIWRSGFEDEAERGVVSADEYLRGFGERMGYPLSAAQWVEARRAAIEPDVSVLSLARQLSTDHAVAMFTNNPLLLKRHIAEVFPAVPSSARARSFPPNSAGASRTRRRSAVSPSAWVSGRTRSCILTTMLPMSRAPGRPGSLLIQSARRQTCIPAWRFTRSITGRVVVDH